MSAPFEEFQAYVAAQLAHPVEQDIAEDGTVIFTSGDPGEVIVRLTNTTVTVAEYAIGEGSTGARVLDPIPIGTLKWRRVSTESSMRAVKALIAAARDSRLAKFRVCRICDEQNPPEWMDDDRVCQSCAGSNPGVVH